MPQKQNSWLRRALRGQVLPTWLTVPGGLNLGTATGVPAGSIYGIGIRPELALLGAGSGRSRFATVAENTSYVLTNISYDGADWNLDNVEALGVVLSSGAALPFCLRTATAGANPRALTEYARIDTVGTATFKGGLNVGTTTAATAGDIRFSGALRGAGASTFVKTNQATVANDAVAALGVDDNWNGLAIVVNVTQGSTASFVCRGGVNTTLEAFDPGNVFSATVDTAASTNVYYNAGGARYEIQNKTGAQRVYVIYLFGTA